MNIQEDCYTLQYGQTANYIITRTLKEICQEQVVLPYITSITVDMHCNRVFIRVDFKDNAQDVRYVRIKVKTNGEVYYDVGGTSKRIILRNILKGYTKGIDPMFSVLLTKTVALFQKADNVLQKGEVAKTASERVATMNDVLTAVRQDIELGLLRGNVRRITEVNL